VTKRVAVIGAGSSGLAAAHNLLDAGFEVNVLEREHDLGGSWNQDTPQGRVHDSATMISSRPMTEYPDFPMPAEFPDYPDHRQALAYLRAYSGSFELDRHIRYDTAVTSVNRTPAGWTITMGNGDKSSWDAVVIANGHNWQPHFPRYAEDFDGESLHSGAYRNSGILKGKRVLVIGRGNSGCDIAAEAADHASLVVSSGRRGYHFIPKYMIGTPSDQVGEALIRRGLSLERRRRMTEWGIEQEIGRIQDFGLPAPDHELFESHPVINSRFPLAVRDGKVKPKPDVTGFHGSTASFADGTEQDFDVVIFATGYKAVAPFLQGELSAWWNDGRPALHLNVFHPSIDTLFFAGLIQPDSGQFGLVHWQSRAIAAFLCRLFGDSSSLDAFRQRRLRDHAPVSGGVRYLDARRHFFEVEHVSYLDALHALVAELSD
jgi:cation diffusion facilitator CzcD-associated flavoprotein CzcO